MPVHLCQCGCGQESPLIKFTSKARELIAGQPRRFLVGHHRRITEDVWERIKSRCVSIGSCLVWQGAVSNSYGTIAVLGERCSTHRVVYEYFFGPIPEGLTIDHVATRGCRFKTCCNPEHLEAVTSRVNVLRGDTVVARNAAKSLCWRGHPLDGDNLYLTPDGRRQCRICGARRNATLRQRVIACR